MSEEDENEEEKPTLEWGQTPWDNKTREELLLEVKRMYSALSSLYSSEKMSSDWHVFKEQENPYYGKGGAGGRALEKGRQILEIIHKEFSSEDIYRSYFRYANDLLFEDTGYGIGSGWIVCPKCGLMLGSRDDMDDIGARCGDVFPPNQACDGVLRKLEWADLEPKKDEGHD